MHYPWKIDRFHLIPIFALLLLLILFYFPIIFLGRTLQGPEMARINPALKGPISAEQIRSGYAVPQIFNTEQATAGYGRFPDDIFTGDAYRHLRWPIWDPYVGAGIPFAAQYESAAFFPLKMIQTIFPTSTRDLFFIFNMWLAGVFTYYFFIRASLNRLSAFFGATLYMTCGAFSWFMQLQEYMTVAMMLPLLMLATYQLSEKNSFKNVGFMGLTTGLMLLAGQPEAQFYCLVLSFAFYFFHVYSVKNESADRIKHQLTYCISIALGLCIASPLLVLFIEAYHHGVTIHVMKATASIPLPGLNARSRIDLLGEIVLPKITDWPIMPLVVPAAAEWDYYGSYVGIIPLFFVAAGFLISSIKLKKEFLFFFFFALFFLMMDIGVWPFNLIGYLPLFRLAWSPRWGGAVWSFSLISAATYGFYFLQQFSGNEDAWKKIIKIAAIIVSIALYASVAISYHDIHLPNLFIFVLKVFYHPHFLLFISAILSIVGLFIMIYFLMKRREEFSTWMLCVGILIVSQYFWIPKGAMILTSFSGILSTSANYILTNFILFLIYLCFFVAMVMSVKKNNVIAYAVLGLTYVATVLFQNTVLPGYPRKIDVTATTPFIQYLQKNAGYNRFFAIDGILLPRFAQVFHLYDVRSTSAIAVRTYQEFVNRYMNSIKLADGEQQFLAYVAPVTTGDEDNYFYHPLHRINKYFKAFSMMSMKYVVMKKPSNNLARYSHLFSKLKLAYQDQEVNIYLNPDALPRVFSVTHFKLADSFENAQIMSVESKINLHNTAILENKLPENWKNQVNHNQSIEHIVEYQPNDVKINFKSDHSALLVLTDIFYPGWTATIDGMPTHIYRVDGLFRGVVVPAGDHVIKYCYFPRYFQIALWVAGISLLFCFIFIATGLLFYRKIILQQRK